jgi:predicted Zn-dependent protease
MRYKEEIVMKRFVILLVIASVAFTGCASGNFLGFIATNKYVDDKTKALADEQARQIADLKAQIADYQKVKEQAQAVMDQVNQNQKSIEDLQALAKRVEGKLDQVPKDVIKQLIAALQAALNE